jgi:hypothetical protein
MQPELANGILVIGAIGVLAGACMAGRKLFGNKTQSVASTILWILVALLGLAAVVWILGWPHFSATAPYDSTHNPAITSSGTISPINPIGEPSGSATPPLPDSAASVSGEPSRPAQPDLVLIATSAILACAVPVEPTDIPDGANATIEQMRAMRNLVITYDAATTAYIKCVDSAVNDVTREYRGVASASNLQTLRAFGVKKHNAAVDQDQALANRMNQQIRLFKTKHAS